jgi:hypothetical protein
MRDVRLHAKEAFWPRFLQSAQGIPLDHRSGSHVELQLDLAVETNPQRLLACLTHWILRISAA